MEAGRAPSAQLMSAADAETSYPHGSAAATCNSIEGSSGILTADDILQYWEVGNHGLHHMKAFVI